MLQQNGSKPILILCCLVFICLGISSSAIGPILPELAANAQVSLAQMGAVFTAFFTGSIVSQFLMGPIADRFGNHKVLMVGIIVLAAGLLAYNFKLSYPAILAFSTLAGLGMGAVVLGNNVLIATTFSDRSVSALNLINLFYGVGAVIGPAIISLVVSRFGSGHWVVGLDALAFLVLVPFIYRLKIPTPPPLQPRASTVGSALFKSPLLWTLAAITLLYVGIETGMGGWITTYMNRTTSLSLETAALVTSGFWMALSLGRLTNSWLGLHLAPERILWTNLCGAAAGSLVFAFSTGSQWISIFAIILMGFSFGAIYPTLVASVSTAFPERRGQAVSIMSSFGSGGGMLIPVMMGYLIEQFGPSSSAWTSVIIIAMMGALLLVVRKSLIQSAVPLS